MRSFLARSFVLMLISLLAPAELVHAEEAGSSQAAPVRVFNRQVATLRGTFLGVGPAERARRAGQMVSHLLDRGGPGVITVQPMPQGNALLIDAALGFVLMPGDVDPLSDETLDQVTQHAKAALESAVAATRESRSQTRLMRALGSSAIATLLLALAAFSMWAARRWWMRRLEPLLVRAAQVQVAGTELLSTQRLLEFAGFCVRVVSWLLISLFTYHWLSYVLNQFPYTRPWGEKLNTFLLGILQHILGAVLSAVPNLSIALIIFLLARAASGVLNSFFDAVERNQTSVLWFDSDTSKATRKLSVIALWLFALVMAYPYIPGSQSEAFKGVSVLVGVMITLGGSSLFGQAASGLIIMYSRTVRVGEVVRIDDHEGAVTELGTFTTKLRTAAGEEVSIPNSVVLGGVTKNFSRASTSAGYILDTTLAIGYDTPWRQVEALLLMAALRTPGVLSSPAPRVITSALSNFHPEYKLICQAAPSPPRPRGELLGALHDNIVDVFNEYGVQIMVPHYEGDPETPKIVPKSRWSEAPAAEAQESAE